MSQIDLIRAEIERLKKENIGGTWEWINARGEAYDNVLKLLEELKKDINEYE